MKSILFVVLMVLLVGCVPQEQQKQPSLPESFTITIPHTQHSGSGERFYEVSLYFSGDRFVSGTRKSEIRSYETYKCIQDWSEPRQEWEISREAVLINTTILSSEKGHTNTWKWTVGEGLCADMIDVPLTRQGIEQAIEQGEFNVYKITTSHVSRK